MNSDKLEEILKEVYKSKNIEEVLKKYGWQDFESFVSWIFEQHDFETKIHYRFKTDKRYEIDVLAKKYSKFLLVECKRWRGKTATRSKITKAVEYHKKKLEEFLKLHKSKTEGIIVTLLDQTDEVDGIKIVPVSKLNYFLLNYF